MELVANQIPSFRKDATLAVTNDKVTHTVNSRVASSSTRLDLLD